MYHIEGVKNIISNETLDAEYQKAEKELQQENIDFLKTWDDTKSFPCRVLFLFRKRKRN
jgi:methylmalonyl-CoA mutase